VAGFEGIRRRLRREENQESEDQVERLLADAASRLDEIASVSRAASVALRERTGDPSAPEELQLEEVQALIRTLVARIEEIEAEALRLARLLGRGHDQISHADEPSSRNGASAALPESADDHSGEDPAVAREQVQATVAQLAGAGASPQEIAAWVFREHGVVVSDRAMNEMIVAQGASAT
jgi:hypothetical protein